MSTIVSSSLINQLGVLGKMTRCTRHCNWRCTPSIPVKLLFKLKTCLTGPKLLKGGKNSKAYLSRQRFGAFKLNALGNPDLWEKLLDEGVARLWNALAGIFIILCRVLTIKKRTLLVRILKIRIQF